MLDSCHHHSFFFSFINFFFFMIGLRGGYLNIFFSWVLIWLNIPWFHEGGPSVDGFTFLLTENRVPIGSHTCNLESQFPFFTSFFWPVHYTFFFFFFFFFWYLGSFFGFLFGIYTYSGAVFHFCVHLITGEEKEVGIRHWYLSCGLHGTSVGIN